MTTKVAVSINQEFITQKKNIKCLYQKKQTNLEYLSQEMSGASVSRKGLACPSNKRSEVFVSGIKLWHPNKEYAEPACQEKAQRILMSAHGRCMLVCSAHLQRPKRPAGLTETGAPSRVTCNHGSSVNHCGTSGTS